MSENTPLTRVRYFQGQLLSAEDFTAEQSYFIRKQRLHNRTLHGWGIVNGLEILQDQDRVFVRPGTAIDCAGNLIVVAESLEIHPPAGVHNTYVLIEYVETETAGVPGPTGPGMTEGDGLEYTRIQESCRVYTGATDPCSNHPSTGPGTPGCGLQHPISIALLTGGKKGWRLKRRLNRRRCSLLRCLQQIFY